MRNDGAHEFSHGEHSRFDVHVSIEQARNDVTICCLDDSSFRANGMGSIRPNIGNAPIFDGNIGVGEDFARLDANLLPITEN